MGPFRSPQPLVHVIVLATVSMALARGTLRAQEGVFLTEAQAPAAVFPDADAFTREVITPTNALKDRMRALLDPITPSVWEEQYITFTAARGSALLGHAIIVEEIGKHRPITFVVGVRLDGRVSDVAVMAYREAYGGEVKSGRFLTQYRNKSVSDALRPYAEIKNIAGATLSVDAASRAVKKALALARVAFAAGEHS